SILPALPISGTGRARYQPIWARDVAGCVASAVSAGGGEASGADPDPRRRFELAGPEVLTYDDIVERVLQVSGRLRRLVRRRTPPARTARRAVDLRGGPAVFATWEGAELREAPMTTARGTADAERLGVEPRPIAAVLGTGS